MSDDGGSAFDGGGGLPAETFSLGDRPFGRWTVVLGISPSLCASVSPWLNFRPAHEELMAEKWRQKHKKEIHIFALIFLPLVSPFRVNS
jgi:hypothetical protein